MTAAYEALKSHFATISDLNNATAVLSWDQETSMPPGGAEARARQMATLSRMAHELLISERSGELIDRAAAELSGPYDADDVSLLRAAQYDYEQATRIPADLVAELTRESSLAHHVWVEARQKSDFSIFRPKLEKLVEMARQIADHLGYEEHPYDALLNMFERGMTTKQVRAIFEAHRPALSELINAISAVPQVDDAVLHQPYDEAKQREFALMIIRKFGFDFERGLQAVSVHPFCTSFSVNDVRITTRFQPEFLNPALFGMMHEAGHAMYEQGVTQAYDGTPLVGGASLGVHESQSRMWENMVGRSRGFWAWALPKLRETFPQQLEGVTLDQFYRAINKVQRSFIRVEADEATYNLHIILRFELEQEMVQGTLKVADLPEAWNSRFETYFGITPPNDALGVLQDVHWSSGLMGYFPTYALGNLLAAQYYNAALRAHPGIPAQIERGEFDTLRGWLRDNIHQHGRKFTSAELTQRITGQTIDPTEYIAYLRGKFTEIYSL